VEQKYNLLRKNFLIFKEKILFFWLWLVLRLYLYQGNGRSFCAGGDVAAVAREGSKGMFYFGFLMDHIT